MEEITLYILDIDKYTTNETTKYNRERKAAEYLIYKYSGEGEIKVNEYGKPMKDNGIFFNISHSENLCIMGICDCDIGVDIEYVKDRDLKIVERFFSSEERMETKSLTEFYKIWTSKESLVKCVGTGLVNTISEIPGLPYDGYKEYKGEKYYVMSMTYDNYIISVTCREKRKIKIIREN